MRLDLDMALFLFYFQQHFLSRHYLRVVSYFLLFSATFLTIGCRHVLKTLDFSTSWFLINDFLFLGFEVFATLCFGGYVYIAG